MQPNYPQKEAYSIYSFSMQKEKEEQNKIMKNSMQRLKKNRSTKTCDKQDVEDRNDEREDSPE